MNSSLLSKTAHAKSYPKHANNLTNNHSMKKAMKTLLKNNFLSNRSILLSIKISKENSNLNNDE